MIPDPVPLARTHIGPVSLTRDFNLAHAQLIRAAGAIIVVLSAGAVLLPFLGPIPGTLAIGILLLAAGGVETWAGTMRKETRALAMLAGATTGLAGMLFFLNSDGELLSSATVVIGWLFSRSVILLLTARLTDGSSKIWLLISALIDLGLGLALFVGLSVMGLVVMIFGAAPQLVASFAWVLAISFLVTGGLLLQLANCEGERRENPLPLQ
jgi:hypothetical protein